MSENKNVLESIKSTDRFREDFKDISKIISDNRRTLSDVRKTIDSKRRALLDAQARQIEEAQIQVEAVEVKETEVVSTPVEPTVEVIETATPSVAEDAKVEVKTEVKVEEVSKPETKPEPKPKKTAEQIRQERLRDIAAQAGRTSQTGEYANMPGSRVYIPQDRPTRTYQPRDNDRRPTDRKPTDRKPYSQDGKQPERKPFGDRKPTDRKPMGIGAGVGSADMRPLPNTNTRNDRINSRQKDKPQDTERTGKGMNKRTLIRKGYVNDNMYLDDEGGMTSRRYKAVKSKSKQNDFHPAPVVIEKAVITTENITVKLLSEKIGKTATEIIKTLFNLGIVTNINGTIDFDTASLVSSEFGVELEQKLEKTYEEVLVEMHDEDVLEEGYVTRPPIVTIMGHVDHGKTSILDYIRKASVASGEAGGITQHIGAYTARLNGQEITFLDTPGHEAFTSMRMRGAQVTDIAILVVAADDGIMPQTIEAINHAKAAGVPIIVAINKMDKLEADPQRIMQQLTEYEILPEEWGGDTMVVPVSAKTGMGIDLLLESILTLAEVNELKGNPNRSARGYIIEARLDKGRGPVATVLVQNGTLKVGDFLVAGTAFGKVRAMTDENGKIVKSAGPSKPVQVQGFTEVPNAGDQMMVVEDEKLSRQVAEERKNKKKSEQAKASMRISLDDLFGSISDGSLKQLNVIVKADVQGSVEAVKQSLEKLTNSEVVVKTIHGGVGAINESDVMLANTSSAIIIGFNVRPDSNAKALAERDGVDIRCYRIIYDAIDDVSAAMKGMLEPKFREAILGHAEVRNTFKVSGVGTIGGCYVLDGKITRNSKLRLLRDNVVIYEGEVGSLKRFKNDVKEVDKGYECGISISGYNDIKEMDVIESFVMEQE
ncbi:MAG: translation initiation factor IF-2 [Clostridia bacterium]|nr:translation initiation factor IF-2 [Clostridia bacterium]